MFTNFTKTFRLFAIGLMLLIGFTQTASAVDFYWKTTGRADQNYTNAANWESLPSSGTPANGSLAPSSTDDVYFPADNATQTINVAAGAAARNVTVLSGGVITFAGGGQLGVYGSFTSNANHQFGSFSINFLGTGNHTIDMGNNASHSTAGGYMYFNGLGTYTLLSAFNVPGKQIYFNTSTFISNGFDINSSTVFIQSTVGGSKTINFANSKVSITGGLPNQGGFVFAANPATTTYDFTNTEININQGNDDAYITVGSGANGTIINGIKSISFTEATPGIAYEHIRVGATNFTFGVTDFNINTSAFNFSSTGGLALNVTNLNLLKPVNITANGRLNLTVNTINETASCVGQSTLRAGGVVPIIFNATAPINTSNIGFKTVTFSGSTVTMPLNNDLGQNTGTYTTTTAVTPRSFYWVGGTGNWNDPTKWSVLGSGGAPQTATGCLPTLNDDVFFDGNSFTATGQTVTITGSGSAMAYARNVYWTDPSKEGKLAGGYILNINGSADFSGSVSVAPNLIYLGTGSHTVKTGTATYTSGSIQFLGAGTYELTDDLICSATGLYLRAGTFNSNGKAITALLFSSASVPALSSNLRNIDISNSVLTFTAPEATGAAFGLSTPFLNSFTATGSTINITSTGSPTFNVTGYVNNSTVTLTSLAFNNINFTATTGTPIFNHSGVLNFSANTVNFASNATLSHHNVGGNSHTVNTYNLTPSKSYTFSAGSTFAVVNAINSNSTGSCSPKVTIVGSSATRARLYKAGLPFTIQNAILRDINASGATLSVPGGEDLGNNLNVNITANPSQNFYWVGGTGNWNDPTHWSIGVSGGNPAITNTNNCIPSLTDDVFFDGNSFSAPSQTVTIDNNAYCRNMLWDNAVSVQTPIFAGVNTFNLYTYGSVTLAANMTFPFNGTWVMRGGVSTSSAITTNGVAVRSYLWLDGGGRYDFLDNYQSNNDITFRLGQFYTNSKNITAKYMGLTVTGANKADISNSTITLTGENNVTSYYATHSAVLANWNATGSTINVTNGRAVNIDIPTGITIDYGKINIKNRVSGQPFSAGPGLLRATDVTWLNPVAITTTTQGNMEIGNLTFVNSSDNYLQSGRTITVTNKLTANGTPCNPIRFRSSTAGTPATLTSTLCNFDIKFARLTDIKAGGTCTIAQNKVVGDDVSGNSNWTFATQDSFQYLGADVVLGCNQYPYTLSTASFNADATSILWSNGATTPDITVTGPGTYKVTVTYGPGCVLIDEIVLGLAPNPVLNATTISGCETTAGSGVGIFNLADANAILVSTPANYTFTYHANSADAIANVNPLTSPYNSVSTTIYVRVAETATGCFSTRDVVLTVSPKVTITASSTSPTTCTGSDGSFTISGLTAGVNYAVNYDKGGVAQPVFNGVATAAGQLVVTGLTIGNYTNIKALSAAGGCETTKTSVDVTSGAAIVPTFTQVAGVCSGATMAALPTTSNNGITGTWSPALNNTTTTLYTFTPDPAGPCASTVTMTITVTPQTVPTFTQVVDVCSGSTMTALPTTSNNGITGTWSPALNNTTTTLYTFTPTAGQCATTATMTITVKPNATLVLTSSAATTGQILNINSPITAIQYTAGGGATGVNVTGLPSGVTHSYNAGTGLVEITGSPTVSGPFNYSVTTTGGCSSATLSGTITVNGAATIVLTSAAGSNVQSFCIGSALTPNIVFTTTNATGVTVSTGALPIGVTGVFNAGTQTYTISGTPTVTGPFTFELTANGAGGSSAPLTGNSITVKPNSTIVLASGNGQTPCVGSAITNIVFNLTNATGASITTGVLPAGLTGTFNLAAQTYTISGTPTAAVAMATYTVTAIGECALATATFNLTVKPNSTIVLASGNGQTPCVGSAITNIVFNLTNATGASITTGTLPAGLTGTFNLAAQTYTISGTPTAAAALTTYTVTATGDCASATATFDLTVKPNSTIVLASGNSQTPCVGSVITNIVFNLSNATGASITTGALPAGLTGTFNLAAQTYTISGTPTAAATLATYTVTATGDCAPATANFNLTVKPNSTIALASGNGQTPCVGSAINNIVFNLSNATGASVTTGTLPSGLTGAFNLAAQTYTISGTPTAAAALATYTVTATGECAPVTANFTLTVNALPEVPIVSAAAATCTAVGTATIDNYFATQTYTFSPVGPSVGAGGIISGMTPGVVYTVSTSNGNCNSAQSSAFSIAEMLSPATAATVTTTAATCASAGTATINGYASSNTYTFSPSGPVVGAGGLITGMIPGTSYTVTTNNGSCSSSASTPFSIGAMLPTPVASISYNPSEYQATGTATVIQTGQTGGTYTASPVGLSINPTTGEINLAASTPNQSYTVTYSFSNGSCTAAANTTVRINGRAATIAYAQPTYCAVGTASVIRTGPTGGTYTASPTGLSINPSTGQIDLATSKAGVYTITYTYQDGTITASSTTTITVNALPTITITTDIPTGNSISLGDVATITATGGVTYSWTGDDIQSGQNTNVIKVRPRLATTYKVTVTNANGCSQTMEITINIVGGAKIIPNNVITPNGDGRNDVWVVKNLDYYPKSTVTIYDRAGRKVYSMKAYKNDWDGSYNGQPLAEGAYVYVIDSGEGTGLMKGTVNIIRDQR